MSKEEKFISVEDFRKLGFLQELNRQFLHPLGVAMAVDLNEDGTETISSKIWDSRDDVEGFSFDLKNASNQRIKQLEIKAEYIQKLRNSKKAARIKLLGSVIEQISNRS